MINKTIIQGRLTRDPDLNTTSTGVEVCNFTVAWSKKYKDSEQKCFLDCTAWRQTGAFIKNYFTKGSEIAVDGHLETDSYTDNEGNKRSRIKLVVDEVHFCGKKSAEASADGENNVETVSAPAGEFEELVGEESDLPF